MVDTLDEGAIPSSSTINSLMSELMMGLIQDSTGIEKIVRD